VPAAIVFDLGRGGDVGSRPGPEFGQAGPAAEHDRVHAHAIRRAERVE
jgi:hypothetical protein